MSLRFPTFSLDTIVTAPCTLPKNLSFDILRLKTVLLPTVRYTILQACHLWITSTFSARISPPAQHPFSLAGVCKFLIKRENLLTEWGGGGTI